jgi:hypothetical protein
MAEMLEGFTLEMALSDPGDEALGAALLAQRRFWKNAHGEAPFAFLGRL